MREGEVVWEEVCQSLLVYRFWPHVVFMNVVPFWLKLLVLIKSMLWDMTLMWWCLLLVLFSRDVLQPFKMYLETCNPAVWWNCKRGGLYKVKMQSLSYGTIFCIFDMRWDLSTDKTKNARKNLLFENYDMIMIFEFINKKSNSISFQDELELVFELSNTGPTKPSVFITSTLQSEKHFLLYSVWSKMIDITRCTAAAYARGMHPSVWS